MAMKDAMALPDIQGVIDPNVDLRAALARPYLDKRTVADTSIDSFGASLIGNAIMLALPMAEASPSPVRRLRSPRCAATAVRWDKAVSWLGTTKAGELMLAAIKQQHKFEQLLLDKQWYLLWTTVQGSKFVAFLVLQSEAVSQAAKYGGPRAAAVVQAIILLSSDTKLLAKWLQANDIPKAQVVNIIDQYLAEGEELTKQIAAKHANRVALRQALQNKAAGITLSPDEAG